MESNICDINQLDEADVLLPPRKRLLAGYKKQSSDANGNHNVESHQPVIVSSSSSSSPSGSSSSEYARLNSLLSNSSLSNEEIAELAKSAASAATKAAEEARAAAEEKAIIASRAMAAVKSALALVDSFNQENNSKEKSPKKNKLKKHVPVQLLYKDHQTGEDDNADEELARKLHRAMNSSPRISKNVSGSDSKDHKHKKLKSSPAAERVRISNGGIVLGRNPASMSSEHTVIGNMDSENEVSKFEKTQQLENGNGEMSHRTLDETNTPGRKRGRLKLKKMSLSSCTSRDLINSKEEKMIKPTPLADKNMGNPTSSRRPLFSMEHSDAAVGPIESAPTWKCQEFKPPACIKQNKVMQS